MLRTIKKKIKLLLLRLTEEERRETIKNSMSISPNCVLNDFYFGQYFSFIKINNDFKLIIEEGVSARNYCQILIYPKANLHIHKNVFFNSYCSINCLGNISIGENTLLGEGVKMYDHNHKYNSDEGMTISIKRDEFSIGKIEIGKNCWIGSNVTILNNVIIGDNVIIGANNLIYKSIPSNTIIKLKVDYQHG